MQKALLPLRYVGISQPMYGQTSHIGLKAIDFGWNQTYYEQSTALLAPFDGKVIWKQGGANCIAFQSNEPVEYADGTVDYMTVITAHDNKAPKVGQTFRQGEVYSHSGTAGNVPLHCHLEVQKGKFQKYTSIKNTSYNGKYNSYIFPNTYIPYDALFVREDELFTTNKANNPYTWKKVGDSVASLIKINKDPNYEYKWSVDGNKYGDKYDITTQGGFGDLLLETDGWERVLKVNGGLFYTYDGKHYACGLEKSRGINNQELEMSAVTDYNKCMSIACVGSELYFASQEWIINNKLNEAYGAITGLGLLLSGKARNDMHGAFNSQWNSISGRTVIGEDKDGNFMSYSFAGVTGKSGMTGNQVQKKCLELGFYNAIMLDGGGSVFREYNGKYDISTTRKVKNALILYRKKKTTTVPKPTPVPDDTNEKLKKELAELTEKYNKLQQDYDLLKSTSEKDISVLKQELDNTKADLANWKSKKEELDLAVGEIRDIINNL